MSESASIVTSYPNPDLDGVACSLAIASVTQDKWCARVVGTIDAETRVVLDRLRLAAPPRIDDWTQIEHVWLVDTHHPNQLSADFPKLRVSRITDHHPGGDPASFPNALIQNERVGAAATLIVEWLEGEGCTPSEDLAVLLQCAIVSNTLDYLAPATTQRDRNAAHSLRLIRPMPEELHEAMREVRRGLLEATTEALLNRDTKTFVSAFGPVIVGQIEAPGALELLKRTDLLSELRELAGNAGAWAAVLNIVDTTLAHSAIVTTDVALENLFTAKLGAPASSLGIIQVNRVLQRKTDVVPFLLSPRDDA